MSTGYAKDESVIYAGAALIPFCVGSVAVPIALCRRTSAAASSSPLKPVPPQQSSNQTKRSERREENRLNRRRPRGEDGELSLSDEASPINSGGAHDYNTGISRCTHVRFCYLRDGASAAVDLAYRRALHFAEDGAPLDVDNMGSALATASPLYALVDRVVFILPNSFPEPCRELTRPPFFVVDDTWAEHTIEMVVHFHSKLNIAPFLLTHMVYLQRRANLPPQLLSSTFAQTMAQPTVILMPGDVDSAKAVLARRSHSNTKEEDVSMALALLNLVKCVEGDEHRGKDCVNPEELDKVAIVSERRDAIRIFHPTERLSRMLWCVYAVPTPPLEQPPDVCVLPVKRTGSDVEEQHLMRDGLQFPSWCFPFEALVHIHEPRRQKAAVDAMQVVLEALHQEQRELIDSIEQKMSSASTNADELHSIIQQMRNTCAMLENRGKH